MKHPHPSCKEEAHALVRGSHFKISLAMVSSQCCVCVREGCFLIVVNCSLWKLPLTIVLPSFCLKLLIHPGLFLWWISREILTGKWMEAKATGKVKLEYHVMHYFKECLSLPFLKRRGGWLRGCFSSVCVSVHISPHLQCVLKVYSLYLLPFLFPAWEHSLISCHWKCSVLM